MGDDVFGDDPTVNRLQEMAARLLGKEAGLFVPTGSMGNQVAVRTHTKPGDAIILDEDCHILHYEVGAPAVLSQVITETVPSVRGIMDIQAVASRFRKQTTHTPGTTLLCLENTHNRAGGTITPLDHMQELARLAKENAAAVHLDGARIFNAAAFLGRPVSELVSGADTVMFCLSKGLGAPVGSLLAGCAEDIARARLYRKRLGGGMRQAGVLAAAGLVALEQMPARLTEDHRKARQLADALARLPGIQIVHRVETNIVIFDDSGTGLTAGEFSERLRERSVLINPINATQLRLVTHYGVSWADCEEAMEILQQVAAACDRKQ